jgi:putative FmdB family regulatory protein
MPIYAYRCSACGHAKDVLQKLSDPVLTVCPACGAATFAKQVTAAGFQLKGSGWYVTDFRDGNKGGKTADKATDKAAEGGAGETKTTDKPADAAPTKAADKPAAPAPAPAASTPPSPSPSSS